MPSAPANTMVLSTTFSANSAPFEPSTSLRWSQPQTARLGPADAAGADLAFETCEMRVEATVEADHQRHAEFQRDGDARLGPPPIEINRLFAEDRLAGARRGFDQVGMGVGRAGDHHRID